MRNSKRRTQNPSISLKTPKSDELPLAKKNISINPEFTIYCLSGSKSINSIYTGKHASTGTSSRCKCPSWPEQSSGTFRTGSPLSF